MVESYKASRYVLSNSEFHLSFCSAETLSEDEEDVIMVPGEGVSISATPSFMSSSSEFTPSPGGPFSALTPSMWPQDILSRLGNPVSDEKHVLRSIFNCAFNGIFFPFQPFLYLCSYFNSKINKSLKLQPEDATGQLDYRYDEFGFKVEEEGTNHIEWYFPFFTCNKSFQMEAEGEKNHSIFPIMHSSFIAWNKNSSDKTDVM